ncbi:MAG: hypothetical protein WCW87_04070 [Candidatus Paceibacterota bacterium]
MDPNKDKKLAEVHSCEIKEAESEYLQQEPTSKHPENENLTEISSSVRNLHKMYLKGELWPH